MEKVKTIGSYYRKWHNCRNCSLHKTREKIVLCRGYATADILIIGDYPDEADDVFGRPFCGSAGMLLNSITTEVFGVNASLAYTNIVACLPIRISDNGRDIRKPTEIEKKACFPRLLEYVEVIKPKVILALGTLTLSSVNKLPIKWHCRIFTAIHPIEVVYMPEVRRNQGYRRILAVCKTIQEFLKDSNVKENNSQS